MQPGGDSTRYTVEFAEGLNTAEAAGVSTYLEIGPEPQLLALAEANGIGSHCLIPSIGKGVCMVNGTSF